MDKASERGKDAKACGDNDIGVHKYGIDNVREQLNGLWAVPSKEVVGLSPSRIATNCYGKECDDKKPDLLDEMLEHGPPILNTSKPHRVF
jgi:hypothetical protein